MEYIKYNEALPYSYVFGAFGTIELLKNKTKECKAIIIDPSFVKNEAYNKIKDICKQNNIPIIIDLKVINKIRDKGNIFVVGVFNKYTSLLNEGKHLVLYDINDVGVIGTIIRSMRGFSFENLALINCKIDLFNEHLIRSTMGAFFQCNIQQFDNLDDYINTFNNNEFINISTKGEELSNLNNVNNVSLIFSKDPLDNTQLKHINFKEDISLDNIVNIVLFNLYSS